MSKYFLIIICCLLPFSGDLFSQISYEIPDFDYANPKKYEIGEISIAGIKHLDHNALRTISGLRKGDVIRIPGDRITDAVEKLWVQGLFSDIKISATKIEQNDDPLKPEIIYLEIFLTERPRLSEYEIIGAKRGHIEDIEEKINIRKGQQVTEYVIMNIERQIKEFYKEKGYMRTEVTITQKIDPVFQNSIILVIDVDRKEKVKIAKIYIEDNEVLSDRKIRRLMKETKLKGFWNFKPSKYIPEKFEEDKQKIVIKYNELGYRDAKITSDSIFKLNKSDIALRLTIEEGNKYYFGDITWVGNSKYPSEVLSDILGINKGDVYDQILLDKRLMEDEDAVGSLYYDKGYLFYRCTPVETLVGKDTINLEMRIVEDQQATINRITLTGNDRTNDHVALRELRTIPGELFSRSDLIRTVRELSQLGHFNPESIVPNYYPDPVNRTVDLSYGLEERANDQVEISGGWGAGMVVGTIGLTFNNFSSRNMFKKGEWRPIPHGDGQSVSVHARSNGKYYQSYSISFMEPWLGGKKPNAFSTSIHHTVQSNGKSGSSRTSMQIDGASVGLSRRLKWPDNYFTLYNSITFSRYVLDDWDYFVITDGRCNNFSFETVFGRNSVDNPMYGRRGSQFSLSLQITPPYSFFDKNDDYSEMTEEQKYEWIEFHKWKFKADWYTQIIGDLVLRSKIEFGYLGCYNSELQSPFEGFNVGGDGMSGYSIYGRETIALRGYNDGVLTDRDDDVLRSNVYTKYTMELRYLVSPNPQAMVYAYIFAEAGNAWSKIDNYNPFDVHRSAGVGVRVFLPMLGLLGIDYGYGFDAVPGVTDWQKSFHFVLGQQF